MNKIAILFSGHLRNSEEIITNLKSNLLDVIATKYIYDIYIHTWDNNTTNDKFMNNDKNYIDKKIVLTDVETLFKDHDININKIIIENQNDISNKIKISKYLENNCKGKEIHNNDNLVYVKDITNKLFWQFYGHYRVSELVDNMEKNYDYVIKTRPDLLYEKFDLDLLSKDLFFPSSHQKDGSNINNLFFGGKSFYMKSVLDYFKNVLFYKNSILNPDAINKYSEKDINFNLIFRFYVLEYLSLKPFFSNYNPKIYRNANLVVTIK